MVELKLAVEQLMAEVKMLRNMQTNTRNSHQTFRNTGALLTTSYATVFIFFLNFPYAYLDVAVATVVKKLRPCKF